MRTIETHLVAGASTALAIRVEDEPGSGGANHRYVISGADYSVNPSSTETDYPDADVLILFQNGPVPEAGVNGITVECLLAIAADRLASFQAGPFKSDRNHLALLRIEEALGALHDRTKERIARDVEGKEVA